MSQRKVVLLTIAIASSLTLAAPVAGAQIMAHPCAPKSGPSRTPSQTPMAKAQPARTGATQSHPCAHKTAGKCASSK